MLACSSFFLGDPSFQQLLNEAEYDMKNYSGKQRKLLKLYARKEKVDHRRRPKLWGYGGMLPQRIFSRRVRRKMQQLVIYFTHLYCYLYGAMLMRKKKGYNSDAIKEVHAKGETSSLQTGKDIDTVRRIYQLS